jgi:hypothetical protein
LINRSKGAAACDLSQRDTDQGGHHVQG